MVEVVAFVIFLALLILLIARNTSPAMYALIAYTPINALLPEGVFYRNIPEMCRMAAFVGVLILCILRKRSLAKLFWGDRLSKAVLAWYLIIIVAFIHSANYTPYAERTLMRVTSYICLYFAIRGWMTKREQLWKCWQVIGYVIAACGILAVFQMISGGYTPLYPVIFINQPVTAWENRAYSFVISGVNAFGGMIGILIPFEIALYGTAIARPARMKHGLILGLGLLGALLSGSRGALMGLCASGILGVYYFSHRRIVRIVAFGTLGFVLPVLIIAINIISPRLMNVDKSASVYERYAIWDQALAMYHEHPVLGIGLGNFRESYDADKLNIRQGDIDTHNVYLQFLTETGIIGLIIYLWMCGEIFWKNIRALRRYPLGSMHYGIAYAAVAATLGVLIHGTVDVLYVGSTEFGAAFMIMMALASKYEKLGGTEWLVAPPIRNTNAVPAIDALRING